MHPTPITAHLTFGNCCSSLSAAVYNLDSAERGESLPTIEPSSYSSLHGCSLVPVAHDINLVYQYPGIHQLYLQSITVRPTNALFAVPWFSLLESLRIEPLFTRASGDAVIAAPLPFLLLRMPRLRKLCVYGPHRPPNHRYDAGAADLPYPDLPCNLEVIFLFGALPIASCAHIISQSRGSLQELRVNTMDPRVPDGADEALLISAIAHAAPGLRILDLRLGRDDRPLSRYTPVFAALDRIETLDLETPQNGTPQEALDLVCHAPIRALTLRRPHHISGPGAPAHIDFARLNMPCLRRILLLSFMLDDATKRNLVEYRRARRILFQAVPF